MAERRPLLPALPIVAAEDWTPPFRYPFLLGVYMATNAIPDAYTVVDGPDCLFFKAEFLHGKHDLRSTLLDVFGQHRIALTNVDAGNVAKAHGDRVLEKIRQIDELPNSAAIFVSSLPMVTIIGTQYDALVRDAQPHTTARLIDCPGRSLQGDWLDGYADLLLALARSLDLQGAAPDPKKVAVIGYLMDRTEGDHRGNVAELRRLVEGLGLELSTVWLGGEPFARLGEVRDAGTLVALPLGRQAAATIAAQTGARVLELDVPFGLARTRRFLSRIAEAAGVESVARIFLDAELRTILPPVEWLIPHVFVGKKVAFSAQPDLLGGFVQLAGELGLELVHLSAPAAARHLTEDLSAECSWLPPVHFEPRRASLLREVQRVVDEGVELVLCNSELRREYFGLVPPAERPPILELGFPSFAEHVLTERPFLGFRGWLGLVERMANALTNAAAARGASPAGVGLVT